MFKSNTNKKWLDEGIRHVDVLCKEAKDFADEGDIIPTTEAKSAAVELMKQFSHAPAPRIGVTPNGEIILAWDDNNERFSIVVNRKGNFHASGST